MDHKQAREQKRGQGEAPPQLLTYSECAAVLGMTDQALQTMVARGQVPGECIVRIGTRVRFNAPAITAWIASMTGGAK